MYKNVISIQNGNIKAPQIHLSFVYEVLKTYNHSLT